MNLGKIFMTCGVEYEIKEGNIKLLDLCNFIEKFKDNNWGELCDSDKKYQNNLMDKGDTEYPYMGSYITNNIKIWLMKGIDSKLGHYTTIMLPEEY